MALVPEQHTWVGVRRAGHAHAYPGWGHLRRVAIRATTHPRPNIRLTEGRSWGAATGKDEDWT
ncbi:hypothetical protein GCM10010255_41810 [Streptomyces coeruleofuscus]|uniref:Uncharacterized protein n=1 Tax=Streptomyces coeruleofuscus TaxID=66879 RepID=A0ABP5VL32_9ACTN